MGGAGMYCLSMVCVMCSCLQTVRTEVPLIFNSTDHEWMTMNLRDLLRL